MKKTKRSCPICSYGTGQILHTQTFKLPKGNPLPKVYDVVCCDKCGFVFADTVASQDVYNSYYKNLSKYEDKQVSTGSGANPFDEDRLRVTAEDIGKVVKDKSSSILDIGCASGGLLLELAKLGFTDLTGSDPSSVCIQDIQNAGIAVEKRGLFSSNEDGGKKYDLVVLTHVLEHIRDLKTAVENISRLVKDGGIVYIEVPDASRYPEFYVVPYYYIDSEHINHLDSDSLNNLFAQFGYRLVSDIKKELVVTSSQKYPAVGVFFERINQNISEIKKSLSVANSILAHIEKSKKDQMFSLIDALATEQKEIIVWGVGSLTQRLLSDTQLDKCNIVAFIDNDSKKVGTEIVGKKILSSKALEGYDSAILVCAAIKSSEIAKQIRSVDPKREIIFIN